MGVKVRGIQQARRNLDALIGDIQGRKALRAIKSALFIIAPEAAAITPVATSTLINSQFNEVMVNGTRITGRIGYSANYALYVHNAPGKYLGAMKLRPVEKGQAKGSMGYIWDKTGEPQFLAKAVEKTRDDVDAVIRKEMAL